MCVDMQGSLKSAMVGRMAGRACLLDRASRGRQQARWFYKQQVTTSAPHVVEQGCELLGGALEEILRPAKVVLPVDPEAEAWCDRLLAQTLGRGSGRGERFAFIAPTAGWGAKQWPAERYGAVAAELGRAGYPYLVNEVSGRPVRRCSRRGE